jgi:bifunctional oligoribonuclease and PAP phosphatase NrnA
MDYSRATAFLEADGPFLLSTHINADGDGLGALLGMNRMITKLGKTSRMVVADDDPDRKFAFLDGFDEIVSYRDLEDQEPVTHAIFVDTPTILAHRVGNVARLIEQDTRTMIVDHHAGSEEGNVLLIDSGASAASELVFHLMKATGVEIDVEMATQIYAGIAFDTKLFKYSHPERALKACAELVDYGADPVSIADHLFAHQTVETVQTLGYALSTLELHYDGRVATVAVNHEVFSMGGDLDMVVDQAMSIDGVEVALFFKEQTPGYHRVSLRSRGHIDVNVIARRFGGGGHRNASGCAVEASLGESRRGLLEEVGQALAQ